MPRITRQIYEYYDNRIVRGLHCEVANDGKTLRILPGAAVINETLVTLDNAVELDFNTKFLVEGNAQRRTDIVVLDSLGNIVVHNGVPGSVLAQKIPALTMLIAQVTLPPQVTKFVGKGAEDEVLSIRPQYVIDTRFEPIV